MFWKVFTWFRVPFQSNFSRGCRCRDCMVVGFTTTYVISAYHHWCCEFESRSERGVKHYVIKFVSDLRQVGGFPRVLRFPPPIKLTATTIAEILLKVALNTIKLKLFFLSLLSKVFIYVKWHCLRIPKYSIKFNLI